MCSPVFDEKDRTSIRFVASQEAISTILSGMSDFEQLNDNASYMKKFTSLSSLLISLTSQL